MPGDSSSIATVILAAGMSRRMGSPKALLDLGGRPLIARLLDSVRSVAQIQHIIVVTGHQPQRIRSTARGDRTRFIHNANYEKGEMLSSIQTGIMTIEPPCDAFFIMLLDQPLVKTGTLTAQIQCWQESRPSIVVPTFRGKRGHPLLIDSSGLKAIAALSADQSLRDFVSAQSAKKICLIPADDDPGVVTDVDTPQDYQQVLELWKTANQITH